FAAYFPVGREDCVAQGATVAYSATPQVGVVKPLRAQGRTPAELLRAPRYEVLPTDNAAELVAAYVPREVTITVTASPRRGMPRTIHLAVALAKLGYHAMRRSGIATSGSNAFTNLPGS